MIFPAFDTYFSIQGVWLLTVKTKESEWKLRRVKFMHLYKSNIRSGTTYTQTNGLTDLFIKT